MRYLLPSDRSRADFGETAEIWNPYIEKLARRRLFRYGTAGLAGVAALGAYQRLIAGRSAEAAPQGTPPDGARGPDGIVSEDARLDLLLKLRRQLPRLPSPRRVSRRLRRPLQGLRSRQLDTGGRIVLTRLGPSLDLGRYDLQGTSGNKINFEMALMTELRVERGQVPGDDPRSLTGLDFCLHDPRGRYSLMGLRMCGGGFIVDRTTFEPVCFLKANEGMQDNWKVEKVSSSPDT